MGTLTWNIKESDMEKTEVSKSITDEFEVRRNRCVTFYRATKNGELITYEASTDGLKFVPIFKSIFDKAKEIRNDFKIGGYNK